MSVSIDANSHTLEKIDDPQDWNKIKTFILNCGRDLPDAKQINDDWICQKSQILAEALINLKEHQEQATADTFSLIKRLVEEAKEVSLNRHEFYVKFFGMVFQQLLDGFMPDTAQINVLVLADETNEVRRARRMLSTTTSKESYENARNAVKDMGLDPDSIRHFRPVMAP